MTQQRHRYSGRDFTAAEIREIRDLISSRPDASRAELSRLVCTTLGWHKSDGALKDMSCRVALLRMQDDALIALPPPRNGNGNGRRYTRRTSIAAERPTLELDHSALRRLRIEPIDSSDSHLWNEYIDRYHYLGYTPLPGAQLRYFGRIDEEIVLAMGFGASAWKIAPRDRWIGWTDRDRESRLPWVVCQARFLILPWILCPNLASRALSLSCRRLARDWESTYGLRPLLLETFVDQTRFRGTCYRAANWIHVGQTRGRGKKDRHKKYELPPKDIWLYPLHKQARQQLAKEPAPPTIDQG